MKGRSSNTRYRMSTKSGPASRNSQSNPALTGLARRADGGMCEGGAAAKNLGKMGRMRKGGVIKRAWGGPVVQSMVNPAAGGAQGMLDPLGLSGMFGGHGTMNQGATQAVQNAAQNFGRVAPTQMPQLAARVNNPQLGQQPGPVTTQPMPAQPPAMGGPVATQPAMAQPPMMGRKHGGRVGRKTRDDGGPVDQVQANRTADKMPNSGMMEAKGASTEQNGQSAPVGKSQPSNMTDAPSPKRWGLRGLFGRKDGGSMPQASNEADVKRVEQGMPGRRRGGKVPERAMAEVGRDEIAEHKKEHKIIEEEEDDDREGRKSGGHITAAKRHSLPKKDFALSGERYPIDTENRARSALARGAANATPAEDAKIKSKVHAKYPDMKMKGKD